jgi:uncharacterized protein YPO0396
MTKDEAEVVSNRYKELHKSKCNQQQNLRDMEIRKIRLEAELKGLEKSIPEAEKSLATVQTRMHDMTDEIILANKVLLGRNP